ALHNYSRAIADADHTLTFMDFVRDHSPSEEYMEVHERYRGFVLFHRTQAAAALMVERNEPERAVDEIREGLRKIKGFFAANDLEKQMEEDGMIQQLVKMEETLRQTHQIGVTLQEQLEQAVANEQYETAAKIRDALRKRDKKEK